VCPWCYIGKRRFEAALREFAHAEDVTVRYRSFELDPQAPAEATESVVEALGRKYGGGAAAGRRMVEGVTEVAAQVGLTFDFGRAPHARTVDAHRLLHLALAEGGPAVQSALNEALLAAYFSQGRSLGDHTVLRDVAVTAGLDPDRVDAVLAGTEYADAFRADLEQARAYGISGVPFFVVDHKYAVSGAQPTAVFAELLEQAWVEAHPRLQVMAEAPACGPDGCEVPAGVREPGADLPSSS